MRRSRGQALLELALCVPVILLLGLGAVAAVQVIDAQGGLQAATDAAVSAATRAPDPALAVAAARRTFAAVIEAYPLRSARITVAVESFARRSSLAAESTAMVDLPGQRVTLTARATGFVEPYRSRP